MCLQRSCRGSSGTVGTKEGTVPLRRHRRPGRSSEQRGPASGRIEVVASGLYTCTGYSDYPDIQLNYADAKQLFQNPLDKYQQVVAVPIRED